MRFYPNSHSLRGRNPGSHPEVELTASPMVIIVCAVALLVGLSNAFTIRLVGLMPISEIFLLAVAAYTLVSALVNHRVTAPLVTNRLFGILLFCQAIALSGYLIADYYRESLPGDAVRGWARMIFLAIDIFSLSVLFGKSPHVFTAYLVGVALSASKILFETPLFGDYWKFGYGYPFTMLVLVLSPLLGSSGAIFGALGIGFVHYIMDYRSMAAACWFVAALGLLNQFSPWLRRASLLMGVIGLVAALTASSVSKHESDNARHGRSNAERSAMITAATEAIVASPFFGHGSWFSRTNVMEEFVEIRTENARLAGVGGFDETNGEEMAIHSQILVSMAEGGILGGAFFIGYGFGLMWALYFCAMVRPWDYSSLGYLLILVCSLMALCFSPFSGFSRVEIAAATGVMLMLWRERKSMVHRSNIDRRRVMVRSTSLHTPQLAAYR